MTTTLSDIERLAVLDEADRTFVMDEQAFRAFYELTARPVWAYLARVTGSPRVADDLLQEAYYRLLRSRSTFESEEHRKNYLYRIATNLANDHRRRPREEGIGEGDAALRTEVRVADRAVQRVDLSRALGQLKPRERALLWLAYAQGCSHDEIAARLGLKASSLKMLLFRARRRLEALLGTES